MRTTTKAIIAAAALALPLGQVFAQATQDQIAGLGDEFTPLGAPMAGNDDGTIPAWTGGITQPPAGYEPGMFHPDPYAGDEILFTITGGSYTLIQIIEEILTPYSMPDATFEGLNNIHFYYLQEVLSPARLAGSVLLVHETLNQVEQSRSAWTYNPGQRRVRRAPNVAYDNPGTASDGLRTNDQTDMFNGAMDRYDWRLVGQREMYIPYNAYKLHSGDVSVDDIVQPNHVNPDLTRYELHRVWVVDATLKDGFRNIYKRRTFYVDADSWQIVSVDQYDSRDELWRVSEGHSINYYEVPAIWTTLEVVHDLQSGRYIANGLDNDDRVHDFSVNLDPSGFTPAALRARGTR